jgi:two-component system sensor kinase FixL
MVVVVVALVFAVQLRVEFVRRQGQLRQQRVEDQLEAEARARRLERQLAHVTRVATAGELATVIAHELNQPLAAIAANAEAGRRLLQMPQPAAYEMSEVLRDIASDGRRAVEVVQALRRLLKRGERQEAPVDIGDVIRTVIPLVRRDLQDAGIRLDTAIDGSLAAVRGDRVLLQQLVLNLVSNAIEALRHAPREPRLTIRARQRHRWVRLSIRDNGGGISRSDFGRIFEPFYTTKPAGMGMGLSISRTIVAAHDGRLHVYNSPAGGAVFTVTLPAWEPA